MQFDIKKANEYMIQMESVELKELMCSKKEIKEDVDYQIMFITLDDVEYIKDKITSLIDNDASDINVPEMGIVGKKGIIYSDYQLDTVECISWNKG